MLDPSLSISFPAIYCPPALVGTTLRNRTQFRRRSSRYLAVQLSSHLVQTDDENGNRSEPKKTFAGSETAPKRRHLLSQENTVGIIGGMSVFSTMIFLEKLVWWSTKDGGKCLPFVVCSDPALSRYLPLHSSYSSSLGSSKNAPTCQFNNYAPIVDNLQCKRVFLEESGARYIVMPCHLSHAWYVQISEGCSLPFLHVGECVARELKEAKLKPIEAGSNVRIGLLGTNATLEAGFYQEKLQNQGFEVVLPDRATMEHIMAPAVEALKRKDMEGARNLLRIGLQLLLVRAVNIIILASDEMQGLLPRSDPLLKKCIDPMDALARSTIQWARSKENTNRKT